MDTIAEICNLADTHLHRYHNEVLARRRMAIIARSHFDKQIVELTAIEEAIRAEFDHRFFAEFPDERETDVALCQTVGERT